MKRSFFAFLLLVFLAPVLMGVSPFVRTDGEPQVQGPLRVYEDLLNFKDHIDQIVTTATIADITLYVRTTGNDSNDCLTTGNACLTIQEAVDRLPKQIHHDVLVDVGAGMFTYLTVSGFNIVAGSLTIQGTLDNPTLTTGTTSGTADGGSTTQCVDSAQTWTADELIGKLILVGGEYRVPYDNDGTTIDFRYPLAGTCNGKAYEIVEQKTVLTGTDPLLGYGPVALANNHTYLWHIYIKNLKTSGGTVGFAVMTNQGVTFENCFNTGAYYGYFGEENIGYHKWEHCYSTGNAGAGFAGSRNGVREKIYGCVANNTGYGYYNSYMIGYMDFAYNAAINGTTGIFMEGCWNAVITYSFIDGNSGFGVQTYSAKSGGNVGSAGRVVIDETTISNNISGGVSVGKGTFFQCDDLVGAGNGNYGVEVFSGSHMIITSDTTITGTSGDATINDGATILTWATDFNDDGDIVVNLDNGCRVARHD